MSPDEIILERIIATLRKVKLEAIVVGNVAAVLQGVPVMTQDIDFFIRDTDLNRKKIKLFAEELSLTMHKREEAMSEVITVEGKDMIVDFVFRLSYDQKFESVRSRAKRIKIGKHYCLVADLEDIFKAKRSANRPKDKATLKLIEDTIRVTKHIRNKRI